MRKILGAGFICALGASSVFFASAPASAHGYVTFPLSRAGACYPNATGGSPLNKDCGPPMWEPFSLEGPKGFPENPASPADGELASTGQARWGTKIDEQTPTRWYKNSVTKGDNTFEWTYIAPHRTAQWRYFMTKPGWDQNKPFTRADLELVTTVSNNCEAEKCEDADEYPSTHTVSIPEDRSGYHVVYAVWDVADTPHAFYQTIDVNVE